MPTKISGRPTLNQIEKSSRKPIMISYVRSEAAQHARDLKTELQLLGCDSYLDVDKIKVGSDWQQSLNNAVLDCELFVALITPTYGETKWTKRELQFADSMNKHIIPINFLKTWPPVALAINLFSIQFIPWKTDDGDIKKESKCDNINRTDNSLHWDNAYVKRAANNIVERYQSIIYTPCLAQSVSTAKSLSCPPPPPFPFTSHAPPPPPFDFSHPPIPPQPRLQPPSPPPPCLQSISSPALPHPLPTPHTAQKNFILISCNPKQKIFSDSIRDQLMKFGYSVWISCENQFDDIKSKENAYNSDRSDKRTQDTYTAMHYRDQEKRASVVVLILSEDYYKSNTCKQQAFYCNENLPVIVVKYDNCETPLIFEKLFEEQNVWIKENDSNENLIIALNNKIESIQVSGFRHSETIISFEQRMYAKAQQFWTNLTISNENHIFVYIANSINSKSLSSRAQSIYKCIGKELASISQLILITGDDCNENFVLNGFIKESPTNFYRVLPFGKNTTNGQTLNVGQSVKERNSVVSQLFKFCLLIDNGDEAIRIAEEFLWNDNYVIPIVFDDNSVETSGELPVKITDMPIGVKSDHWNALFAKQNTPEIFSMTVKNIISSLTTFY